MSNPSEVKNKLNLIFIFRSLYKVFFFGLKVQVKPPHSSFFLYKHQDMCWREGKAIAVDGTQKEVIFIQIYIPTHNRKYNNIKSTVMKSFPLKQSCVLHEHFDYFSDSWESSGYGTKN